MLNNDNIVFFTYNIDKLTTISEKIMKNILIAALLGGLVLFVWGFHSG